MAERAVEIAQATRVYEMGRGGARVEALRGADLVVERGEFVVLMGPSGSGKSTLLNLVGCLDTADGGSVRILGRDVTRERKSRLASFRLAQVGFVFQRFNLIPHLTALENVMLPLDYARPRIPLRERRARAEAALQSLGLGERLTHRPEQLSGGEQQRTGIARAIVHRPALLLADEPTGELDTATGAEIVDALERLRSECGATLLVVSHDPAIAERSDRTVRMRDGRVEG